MFVRLLSGLIVLLGLTLSAQIVGRATQGTKASCCVPGAECCFPGSPCCGETKASCCAPGAECCFPGSPCCKEAGR